MVDGIVIGEDVATVHLPCGEKLVTVEKEGFRPYSEYQVTRKGQPLAIEVKLERMKAEPELALSAELIAKVRKGELGPKAVAKA